MQEPHEELAELVDAIDLPQHYLLHAVRADLLRRLGRHAEAASASETALALAGNAAERAFLRRRYVP
jgi:RNA polymerase sigma-70 factor (ECF subfamily)